jgi:hypothetical protein
LNNKILLCLTETDKFIVVFQLHNTTECPVQKKNLTVLSQSRNSPHFVEPEGSLPHLQALATCPCPEPDQSSPCPHPNSWRFFLILSSHLRLGLLSGLVPSGLPTQTLYTRFPAPYVSHALPSRYSWFYHPNNIWWGVRTINLLIM